VSGVCVLSVYGVCDAYGMYGVCLVCAQMSARRFVNIFMGLLLNVVLFILFALCCILIYSLLMINVQVMNIARADTPLHTHAHTP